MLKEYVHPEPGREVTAIGGRYEITGERRLELGDRVVLYLTGIGLFDSSCCGFGGVGYAIVPGYLEAGDARTDDQGRRVSLVAPIEDPDERRTIEAAIKEREAVAQVNFL